MRLSVFGILLVLAASPLLVWVTGATIWYTLAISPLLIALWVGSRLSPPALGLRMGTPGAYLLALSYPVGVMGVTVGLTAIFGAIHVPVLPAPKIAFAMLQMVVVTFCLALMTEEGFFRGWLWGMLERAGRGRASVLLITSSAFCIWHLAIHLVMPRGGLSLPGLPAYLGNIFLLGINLGQLRMVSGSILAPALGHALWNALQYILFGFAAQTGVLSLSSTGLWDPERGLSGLFLNGLFAWAVWVRWGRTGGFSRQHQQPLPRAGAC